MVSSRILNQGSTMREGLTFDRATASGLNTIGQGAMTPIFQRERFTGNENLKRSFEGTQLVDCHFEDYVFEGANFVNAVCVGCTFKNVDFYWASMFRAKLDKCELE